MRCVIITATTHMTYITQQALPLGPEFQWQVNALVQYNVSGQIWIPTALQPDINNIGRFFQAVRSLHYCHLL